MAVKFLKNSKRIKKLLSSSWLMRQSGGLGMAIPRRISFLEESRSQGMAKLHSSGIEEYEIYSSWSSGNFRGMRYPKNPENLQKNPTIFEKKIKKKFQSWISISKFRMFGNNTKYRLVILKNRKKTLKNLDKVMKIFWYFLFFSYLHAQKGNSVFSRSSASFDEDSRTRGVRKSIPRGIEEWKKVRDRGTRNSSCHP